MTQITKILFTAIASGFLSAIVFLFFAGFGIYLFLKNSDIPFFLSPDPLTPFDEILILLCLFLILMTIAICPYVAYKIQNLIFEVSPLSSIRILLFSLVSLAQIIFLTLGYFFVLPIAVKKLENLNKKSGLQTQQKKIGEKIIKQLQEANVEVVCKRAKIVHFSDRRLVGEFVLQVRGVPDILNFYGFQIPVVNEDNGFKIGKYTSYSSGGRSITVHSLSIKAAKTDGKWLFYGGENQKEFLGNDEEFTVRLEFYRENPDDTSYPETITPELKTYPITNSDFSEQRIIFNKPIPVSFCYY